MALSTQAIRQLYHGMAEHNVVRLQVLGIYRYMADPALKERLGEPFANAHDVYDVLLSDEYQKMKAVLAPNLSKLVWKRELTSRSFIQVTSSEIFAEGEQYSHRVVLLKNVAVISWNDEKIVPGARRHRSVQLNFVSKAHPREVALLPLVGERLYYMPLRSDSYTLDWACSFTGGLPEEDSPLSELESNWLEQHKSSRSVDGQQLMTTSIAWNSEPVYCSDLFTPECNKLNTILKVLSQIKNNTQQELKKVSMAPMLGVIRVKSIVKNVGDSNILNPFPFVFNAVVVDATGVFEVMFFGSMCAKYYLTLHEGDLISFRGYSAANPQELQWTKTTSPLVWYPHDSSGGAYHVPSSYLCITNKAS
ncbi:hypothetical protein CCR75_008772 [Bremia lactucae]|uniref:Uncharacterized protein n=1 Tax=Bremia lactucae TaxID=4779 RepID=A0A976IIE9_BRELC|nr:hypothetical protein CCR75_008772 [Bremia lactucae]